MGFHLCCMIQDLMQIEFCCLERTPIFSTFVDVSTGLLMGISSIVPNLSRKFSPLVYALLPDKSTSTYKRVFRALQDIEPTLNPTTVLRDFEKSLLAALDAVFPNATLRGCLFHFNQCIYRAIQRNGLKKRYDTDADFALQMRYLSALAFVPIDDIARVFEHLVDINHFPEEAEEVVEYFEEEWIGRLRSRRSRKPQSYSLDLWNCYNATLEGLPRTNNAVPRFRCIVHTLPRIVMGDN